MAEVGSAQVAIVPTFTGFRRAVNSEVAASTADAGKTATDGFSKAGQSSGTGFAAGLGKAAGKVGDYFKQAGSDAIQVMKTTGVVAAGVVSATLVSGFARLTAIDTAKAKLLGLGNSASQVTEIMNNALSAVQGTAYSLSDAATIAASAVAAGIPPGKELTKYLGQTADAAAIAGTSLADMGDIYNKVTSQGRVYTRDLQQLAERGIPIYEWLGQSLGVSRDQLQSMVTSGQVSAEQFRTAIADNIGGAAQNMGNSVAGALANMRTGFARLGATILGGGFAILPQVFMTITNGLDALGATIGPVFNALGSGLAASLGPILDKVNAFFTGITAAASGAGSGINLSGLLGPLTAFAPVIGQLVGSIGPLLKQIPFIGQAFSGITGPLGGVIGIFVSLMANSSALRSTLMEVFTTVGSAIMSILKALGPSLQAFSAVINDVFGQVGDIIASVLQELMPLIPVVVSLFAALAPIFPPIIAIVGQLASALIGVLGSALTSLLTVLVPVISQLAPIFSQLVAAVMPLLSALMPLISAILPPLVQLFMAVLGPVLQLAGVILGALMPVISALVQILAGLINFVVGVFTGNWSQAFAGIGQVAMGLVNVVKAAISGVISILSGLLGSVGGIFSGVGNFLVSAGKSLIQGFINGIKSMIGAVGDAIGGVLNWAKSFFPHSPAARGPFSGSGWRQLSEGGSSVIDEFTGGMVDAASGFALPGIAIGGSGSGTGSGTGAGLGGGTTEVTQNIYEAKEDPRVTARAWSRELVQQLAGSN